MRPLGSAATGQWRWDGVNNRLASDEEVFAPDEFLGFLEEATGEGFFGGYVSRFDGAAQACEEEDASAAVEAVGIEGEVAAGGVLDGLPEEEIGGSVWCV